MKLTLSLWLLCAAFQPLAIAQMISASSGARSSALGHCSSPLSDIWSGFNNQAGLSDFTAPAFGLSTANPYFLEDILKLQLSLILPTRWGNIGLIAHYEGFYLFSYQNLGLNYSRRLGSWLQMGLQLSLNRKFISEGGESPFFPIAEAGLIAQPSKKLRIGFHFYNFTNSSLRYSYPTSPQFRLKLGSIYHISDNVNLLTEIRKSGSNPEQYALGVEYDISEKISLRSGLAMLPVLHTLGFGYTLGRFDIILSYEYGHRLGSNGVFSLNYRLP